VIKKFLPNCIADMTGITINAPIKSAPTIFIESPMVMATKDIKKVL
jgi:hypothetical protein